MNQELVHFYVKEEALNLVGKEELNGDTSASVERGNDVLSLYMSQLKYLPLSAETEKRLCIEIKQKEKEIVDLAAYFFDLIENHFNLKGSLLCVKPNSKNSFSFAYCYPGCEGVRPNGIKTYLEKINALRKEVEKVKFVLSKSEGKTPDPGDCREVKERYESEISKLISRMRLGSKEAIKIIHQLEMKIKRKGTDEWKQIEKELEHILKTIGKDLLWIRKRKNELIKAHLTLVIHVAKKYRNRGMDLPDLIQEGNQGLIRALDTFDYRRGNRLTSYAIWWIKQSIIRAIYNQSRTMRIPVYLFERLNRYLNASENLSQKNGKKPTLKKLASEMKVSVDNVAEMVHVFAVPLSLEDYTQSQTEKNGGNGNHKSVSEMVIQSDLRKMVGSFLENLSPRESEIIKLRFGINGMQHEHSLQEIGRRFNLSRERIRQIESAALIKLGKMNRIQELKEFIS